MIVGGTPDGSAGASPSRIVKTQAQRPRTKTQDFSPMSTAPGSHNNVGHQKPAAEDRSQPRAADSTLLERVLQQTQAVFQTDEPLSDAEMQSLRAVADRHRGRPLELEPVGVELVAAAIDGICPSKKDSDFWRSVSLQVARILLDDPTTFARLNALWIGLGGGT
jgi:hypothetical protein